MTGPPQILIVEDDPNVRGLLETLLSTEGYDVATASDGLGGLSKLNDITPALMLLDMMMPDLGGARVLERVKSDPSLAAVPVVVLTGKLEAVPALREELGHDNVFVKPFGVNELLARVAQITGGAEAQ
jgi:DNA-binding response OmpR family regulator